MYRMSLNPPVPETLHWKQAECPSDVTASRSGIMTAGGYTGISSSGETTSGTKEKAKKVIFKDEEWKFHFTNVVKSIGNSLSTESEAEVVATP